MQMISKVIISGQPSWVVKMHLQRLEIHTLFGLCPECGTKMQPLDHDKGVCLRNVGLSSTCESWDDGGGVLHEAE